MQRASDLRFAVLVTHCNPCESQGNYTCIEWYHSLTHSLSLSLSLSVCRQRQQQPDAHSDAHTGPHLLEERQRAGSALVLLSQS